jgi:hypothetical protein
MPKQDRYCPATLCWQLLEHPFTQESRLSRI